MNFNNFTIKSQETIQQAMVIANSLQNQQIENGHLLKALLTEDAEIIAHLFKKLHVNTDNLIQVLDRLIGSYPKVIGGETFLSSIR